VGTLERWTDAVRVMVVRGMACAWRTYAANMRVVPPNAILLCGPRSPDKQAALPSERFGLVGARSPCAPLRARVAPSATVFVLARGSAARAWAAHDAVGRRRRSSRRLRARRATGESAPLLGRPGCFFLFLAIRSTGGPLIRCSEQGSRKG
jgi:hypothetical protein